MIVIYIMKWMFHHRHQESTRYRIQVTRKYNEKEEKEREKDRTTIIEFRTGRA